jgi:hypothetical protein
MITELQRADGTLLAVGDLSWEGVPHVGDTLIAKDRPCFYKTHAAHAAAARREAPGDVWYGRVRVLTRKFLYCHGSGLQAVLELTVEDLAASESLRSDDWSKPDPVRKAQAIADVEARITAIGSLEKATVRYLYEAMRAARASLRAYSPLILEIDEVLRRNGFDK